MIIFLDARGNIITPSAPEPIGRNSNDAGVIYVVAPISQAANIYMTFTLPNGEPLFGDILEKVSKGEEVGDDVQASYVFTLPDGALSVWRYRVPASVTRVAGVVQYTIVTVTDSMRATASGTFTVSRGNRLILPNDPTPDAWNRVLEAVGYKNADIDQILEEIYGVGGTVGDAKEGGILDRVQKLEERDEVNTDDIADLQTRATDLGKVDRAIIGDVPFLELADVDTPLSVVLAKAQEYWNDQEPQVVVSGPAEFRVFEDGVFRAAELDVPPFTRISFDLGGDIPRGTAYLPDRVVHFSVAGDIADNTVMITSDVTLEDVDKKASDNREELDFLDEHAATDLSVGLAKKDELSGKEYILHIQIKNRYGDILSDKAIDLPLEMAFVGAKLSEDDTAIIFELQNGETVELPVDSIVGKFNIVQGTGNSTDAVMSQEATTKELEKKVDKPEDGVELVKATDYASPSKHGIVMPVAANGTGVNAYGQLYLVEATDAELSAKKNHYKPVTPSNLDHAVKVGTTTNTIELTDAEQKSACDWIGALAKSRFASQYGVTLNPYGNPMIVSAYTAEINGKTNAYRAITPSVLDQAVKVGITTNTKVLTEAEKQSAQEWLGVKSELDMLKKAAEGKLYSFQTIGANAYSRTVPGNALPKASLDSMQTAAGGWVEVERAYMQPIAGTYESSPNRSATLSYDAETGIFELNGALCPSFFEGEEYDRFDELITAPVTCPFSWYDFIDKNGTIKVTCISGSATAALWGGFNGILTFEFPTKNGQSITLFGSDYQYSDLSGAITSFGFREYTMPNDFTSYRFKVEASVPASEFVSAPVTEIVSKDASGKVLQTLSIPSAVQALEGYGKSVMEGMSGIIDFDRRVYIQYTDADGNSIGAPVEHDISAYIGEDDSIFQVAAGGTLTFVNELIAPVNSDVTYQIKL